MGAIGRNEGGIDLGSKDGTPIYALADGYVIGAGYFYHPDGSAGNGVVTTRINNQDGTQTDLYYQHITIDSKITLCNQRGGQLYGGKTGPAPTFQQVKKNQLIGVVAIGMGETEVGMNADWGGIWGNSPHPGAWENDPEDYIRSLMALGGGNGINVPSTGVGYVDTGLLNAHKALQTLSQSPGLQGPIILLDQANHFTGFSVPNDNSPSSQWPIIGGVEQGASYPSRVSLGVINFILSNILPFMIRSIVVLAGIIILLALIINASSSVVEQSGAGDALKSAGELALL
jgi:hypothetical protein